MIRVFDLLFSLFGLLLLIPIFLVIAIAVKISSKGPIFYKQERVGKLGKPFRLYKFRSMYINSDKKGLITVGNNDSRITPVGRFLRKYKLDELPQLINVLKGSMSIVGPRPEVSKYVVLYNDYQRRILSIKPGITDFASIYFRNENEILSNKSDPESYYINVLIPQKIRLNMIYILNYNFKVYFFVIFKTIKSIFFS